MVLLDLALHCIGHDVGRVIYLILDMLEALLSQKAGDLLLPLGEVLFEPDQLDFPLVNYPEESKLEFFKGLEQAFVNSFSKYGEVDTFMDKLSVCLFFTWVHLIGYV